MGLGKTFITVSFIYMFMQEKHGTSILIACPKVVIRNWRNEFEKWLSLCKLEPITCYCMDDSTKKQDRGKVVKNWKENGGVLIISYEMYSILVGMTRGRDDDDNADRIDALTGQIYSPISRKKKKKQPVC
jgi:hypothetical protein